jgi:hypothetical protein
MKTDHCSTNFNLGSTRKAPKILNIRNNVQDIMFIKCLQMFLYWQIPRLCQNTLTKLNAKNILATDHRSQMTTPPPHSLQTKSKAQSTSSLKTHKETSSLDSAEGTLPLCIVVNDTTTATSPTGTDMQLQNQTPPDTGPTKNSTIEGSSPTMTFGLPMNTNLTAEAEIATRQQTTKQDNFTALAHHLYSHVGHLHFHMQADVATWCQLNIKIEIIWQSNPIALQKKKDKILPLMCC